ncbi:MAG TPA: hypothetical protein VNL74_00920 [Methylococcus sp.]|nr:hypothetical protein [Methylococcus sp.]
MARQINVKGYVAGSPVVINLEAVDPPLTITLIPGAGNTSRCEYSTTPGAAGDPGTAAWIAWPGDVVSTPTTDVVVGPVSALRFTRVSGSSQDSYEVLA